MAAKAIPEDLTVDILSRLPAKDLLRYRCVAKPWRSMIDDPDFIKKHLDRCLKTASNLGVVIRECDLHWLSLDSLDSVAKLSHPIEDGGGTEILGSCNGLVALYNCDEVIALWNPSTKRYRKLPSCEIESPEGFFVFVQFIVYGFGHDPIENDYKLVRMVQFYADDDDSFISEVKVYSTKTDTWKRICDFPYYLRYKRGYGVLASNSLHWVVSRKPESDVSTFIAAIDLVTEQCRVVPMPDFDHGDKFHMNVKLLGGSLCVLCNFPSDDPHCDRDGQSKGVDVRVMKEYGVKESWTKLFSVAPSVEIGSFSFALPVAYLKGGEGNRLLVDMGGKKFVTYDLKNGRTENLKVYCTSGLMETFVCLESLVGLEGGDEENGWKNGGERKKKKDHEKNQNQRKELNRKRDSSWCYRKARGIMNWKLAADDGGTLVLGLASKSDQKTK